MKLSPLLALAAALGACAYAQPRREEWSEVLGDHEVRVVLRHAQRDAAVATQVRSALRGALPVAERWGRIRTSLTVTIHATHEELEEAARRPDHAWLRAWAHREGVELQSPRTWSRGRASDAELTQLLAHELTHCVMFQVVADDRLARTIPVWFREGMATATADESFGGARAADAAGRPREVTATSYRDDSLRVYATADRAFRRLVRDHGDDRVRLILAGMRDGVAFDEAFRRAVGISVFEFEAALAASPPGPDARG